MIPAFGYEKRLYSVLMLSSPLTESIGFFGRYRTANQSVIYFAHSQMFGMFCVYRLYQFRVYALASSLPYRERHSVNTMPNISNQTQNTHHNVTWYTHWIFFGRHTQTPIRNVIRNTNTNSRCNAKKKNLLVQVCFLLIYAIRIWCCFDLLFCCVCFRLRHKIESTLESMWLCVVYDILILLSISLMCLGDLFSLFAFHTPYMVAIRIFFSFSFLSQTTTTNQNSHIEN